MSNKPVDDNKLNNVAWLTALLTVFLIAVFFAVDAIMAWGLSCLTALALSVTIRSRYFFVGIIVVEFILYCWYHRIMFKENERRKKQNGA